MKKVFVIVLFLCSLSLYAATDYVMLTPLDSTALPFIAKKDVGGKKVRADLAKSETWDKSLQRLVDSNFSSKCAVGMARSLYFRTHTHMVDISCAYWSKDVKGDSLLVSGKIYLPEGRELRGIFIANHYTIAADYEAPSRMFSMDCVYAMKGYAVIMPDYVGYGLSREEVHPYLHWRSAAQTAVDLLNCMPSLLDYYGYSYPKEVVVSGYSQGGAVALGVVRMLDEEGSDWVVRKLYAGGGPYDPAATYDYCVSRNEIGIPVAVPMIVMGLSDAYDLGLKKEEFFLEPLLSHYDEWVSSKEYTTIEISYNIGTMQMDKILTPAALDRSNPSVLALYDALQKNSNVGYAIPCPAYFLHSVTDNMVPYVNSENLRNQMPDTTLVVFDFGNYGMHTEGSFHFMKHVYIDL